MENKKFKEGQKIEKTIRLLSNLNKNNWKDVRDASKFILREVEYPFGKRNCYFIKNQKTFEDLQASRGIYDEEENIEQALASLDISLEQTDFEQIKELEKHLNISQFDNFVELGFRCPKLLKYYQDNYGLSSFGYDVVDYSIMVAKQAGYSVEKFDLNNSNVDLDLKKNSLIVAYHVLEHVSEPLKALKNIYNNMDQKSYFHVEVPLEYEQANYQRIPQISSGHMFPFAKNDLQYMLKDVGFEIISKIALQNVVVDIYCDMERTGVVGKVELRVARMLIEQDIQYVKNMIGEQTKIYINKYLPEYAAKSDIPFDVFLCEQMNRFLVRKGR